MQENTGKIITEDELNKLTKEKQSQYFKVPEKDKYAIQGMNRAGRRAYAKQNRRNRK